MKTRSLILVISILVSLKVCDWIASFIIEEENKHHDDAISETMKTLEKDSELGFRFKKNLHIPKPDKGWLDQKPRELTTDSNGFANYKNNLINLNIPKSLDVLSVGDSFMYGASDLFYDFFTKKNLTFYNLAMFRYGPPQYNLVLQKYGFDRKPKVIIYGIFENDFYDTYDFEDWSKSNLDWFSYHNGNFFQYPEVKSSIQEVSESILPNISYLYRKAIKPQKRYSFSSYRTDQQVQKVFHYIEKANHISQNHNIDFYCVLIPARDLVNGATLFNDHYNILCGLMNKNRISFIDLRSVWDNHEGDRSELYYKLDNHWNDQGIQIAASSIYNRIKSNFPSQN